MNAACFHSTAWFVGYIVPAKPPTGYQKNGYHFHCRKCHRWARDPDLCQPCLTKNVCAVNRVQSISNQPCNLCPCYPTLSPKNGLQNKPFTKKHSPRKRSTKQSFTKKHSPKNILQENGLQNKPFTKKYSPRKRSRKQTVHQKTFSKKGGRQGDAWTNNLHKVGWH